MTDQDESEDMLARAGRARERETRAGEHEREARRKAAAESDPGLAAVHRTEAETHARAARVHHDAVEFQTRHAQEHVE